MLVMLIGAAAVASALPVLWWALSGADPSASAATRNLAGGSRSADMREALLAHGGSERAVQPTIEALARRARRLTPTGMVESMERRVLLAGTPQAWPIERVLAAKLVLGGGGLAFGLLRLVGSPSMGGFLLLVLLAGLGYLVPDIALKSRAAERQKRIGEEMADTLDQITICVEAGLAFEAAMARAAASGTGPLAEELSRTLQDVRAGMSRGEALRRLTERTDVPELRHFVLAIIQAESYGVPVAQVLRIQSRELRVKRRQTAEERAMKLPVKVLFPLVVCILPAMFIVIIGPGAIRIAHNLIGRA
jgi:tight adherence protein C